MKPVTRWSLVGLAVVVIAILFLLWSQRDKQQAPADTAVAQQPVAPMPPKVDEPVIVSVHFDFDRSVLRAGEIPKLDELTAKVKSRAFDRIDAVGHADQIGGDTYNLHLSEQRAEAVRAYLVGKGVDGRSIRTEGKGESEAITGDACGKPGAKIRKSPQAIDCLQPDRRVQITLVAAR